MTDDLSRTTPGSRRNLWLAVAALLTLLTVVAVTQWRAHQARAAEDCEQKPPPTQFAVATCDSAPAAPR